MKQSRKSLYSIFFIVTIIIVISIIQMKSNNNKIVIQKIEYTEEEIKWLNENKGKKFTMATEGSENIITFNNSDAKGIQYKIIEKIKEDLGINVEVVSQPSVPVFIKSIENQQYDIYIGPNKSEERLKYVNFMPETWESAYYCYYNKVHSIVNIYSLEGHRVGFLDKDFIIGEVSNLFGKQNYTPIYYKTREDLFMGLEKGEVDAIFTGIPYINYSNDIELGFKLHSMDSSLGRISVNKKQPILSSILNKEIDYLKKTGVIDDIYKQVEKDYNKYIVRKMLTEKEKKWLEENKTIYIGFANNTSPYNIYSGGKYKGINVEYINTICEYLDIEYKAYKNINLLSWKEVLEKCENGEIFLITTTAGEYNDNSGKLLYSIPYFKFDSIVIGRNDANKIETIHDLENKRVVIVNSSPISYFLKEKCAIKELYVVNSQNEAINMIKNNKADYTVYSNNKMAIEFNKILSENLNFKGELNIQFYHQFAISGEHKELLGIMNKVITLVYGNEIINNYNYFEMNANEYRQKILRFMILSAIIIFGSSIIILYRLYRSSEQKRKYENKIRKQEMELQKFSIKERGERAASIAFVEWNMKEDILIPNDFIYELIGWNKEELTNKIENWIVYVHPEDKENFNDIIKKAKDALIDVVTFEYRYKNGKTLEYMWLKATYKILEYDQNGKPTRAIGMHQDVTQMKEMEQTIIQNEKMTTIGQLASGIAHDFNNILTGILGYAELLNTKYLEDQKHRQWAEQIINSTNRAASLTRKLLDFSRKSPMVRKNMDINRCIMDAIKILHYSLNKSISIEIEFQKEKSIIKGDETQLETIFINLGVNANDAMPNGGQLIFKTEEIVLEEEELMKRGLYNSKRKFVRIEVIDTGHGMSKEIAKKIFEPFFTTKEAGKGVGLGLSSVEGIVTAHKGIIELQTRENEGTIFTIYLPLEE